MYLRLSFKAEMSQQRKQNKSFDADCTTSVHSDCLQTTHNVTLLEIWAEMFQGIHLLVKCTQKSPLL